MTVPRYDSTQIEMLEVVLALKEFNGWKEK